MAEIAGESANVAVKRETFAPTTAASVALLAAVFGFCLLTGGVYFLAGIGWAMIVLAIPCLLLSTVLVRGLLNGE